MSMWRAQLVAVLLRWRVAVAALLFALVALSGNYAARVGFADSIESWFLDSDPIIQVYDRFTNLFRADEIVVAAVFADDVFAPSVLEKIDRVTRQAAEIEFALRVRSITNMPLGHRVGGIEAPDFREQVLASPLARGTLVSKANDAAAIVIQFDRAGNTVRGKSAFVGELRELLQREFGEGEHALTGGVVLNRVSAANTRHDLTVIFPSLLLVIAVVCWLIFRQWQLALLPLFIASMSVTVAFGVMGVNGWGMTIITPLLVPLILAVGVADAIHVLVHYQRKVVAGAPREDALRDSMTSLFWPCLITTLTTAAGLLALLTSRFGPLREFAIVAASGVSAALILSYGILPALLLRTRRPATEKAPQYVISDAVLAWLLRVGRHSPLLIVSCGVAVLLVFAWLAARIDVRIDPMSWMPEKSTFRADTRRIDAAFGGSLALEFLVDGPEGTMQSPATLREFEAFEEWLVAETPITHATSLADIVKETARIARDGSEEAYALPKTVMLTSMLIDGLSHAGVLGEWVSPDFSHARISARIPLSTASNIVAVLPKIRERIDAQFAGNGLNVTLTGQAEVIGSMQTYIINGQIMSFLVALGVISLLMMLFLRSVAAGLVAMIPNLFPIVVGLGAMTLLGIDLGPGTIMIGAVALGVIVDDTVHFTLALRQARHEGASIDGAIEWAIGSSGQPILVTSFLLACGFLVLLLGRYLPTQQIGSVIAIVVTVALLADLVLLPAVLRLRGRRALPGEPT
jgi:predicted RND superfamily exporter protein